MQQHLKKIIVFFLLFIFISQSFAIAQISKIELGINGLTCSQCSRSVEMKMKKIDFIHSMQMDLEDTKLTVSLDTLKEIDWYAFPKAIKDAGFSIRYLSIMLDDIQLKESGHYFIFQNTYFYILDHHVHGKLNGAYQVIGESFMPGRSFSKFNLPDLPELKNKELIYLKAVQ